MLCHHLADLEAELQGSYAEIYRGRPWSQNCREWVYFDCVLDRKAIRARLPLAGCVLDHEHLGTIEGAEAGFVCELDHDAIMGVHPDLRRKDTRTHR
jgi:hypothetical protein